MRGTIRRHRDGKRWEALVKVRDPLTGQWRQKAKIHATERAAEQWLAEQITRNGLNRAGGSDATVDQLIDTWLPVAPFQGKGWKPSTQRNNLSIIEAHLRPRWGKTKLSRLTKADLDAWRHSLLDPKNGGLSPATVTRVVGVFSRALDYAVKVDMIGDNPLKRLDALTIRRQRITPPSVEVVASLLENAFGINFDAGMFLRLAVFTGARRGELCAIRWSHLDLDAGTLVIRESVTLGPGDNAQVGETKTGNVRLVGLDVETVELLTEFRTSWQEWATAEKITLTEESFIFSLDGGESPWSPDYASSIYERVRRNASVTGVRLHDLRHFHATNLLADGIDLATVAKRLGHAGGGKTTLAIYAHGTPAADMVAAERFAQMMSRKP